MILNAENTDLHIVVSTPKANLLSSNKLKPLSTLTLPFMAWLFGFIAIWISLDRLLLVHLRTMRGALLGFARGHTDVRVGDLNKAPDRISELGRAFDRMAEMVDKREVQLRESLGEKENLLREIHHRVKNNLQIVISLLNIQERKLDDERGLEAIRESRNRINAISLVHKELYESGDLRFIDMSPFIKQIVTHLRRALLSSAKNVKIHVNVDCQPVDSDTATPIALFIVEAMTNSVKHGIGKNGVINIHISQDDSTTDVIVSDNGSGNESGNKAATSKAEKPPSSGMGARLMSGFARQLSGTYHAELTPEGYITRLSFPNPKH
jgi:two-component sensor histidine kinase